MATFSPRHGDVSERECPAALRLALADSQLGPRFDFAGDLQLAAAPLRIAMIGTREPGAESVSAFEALAGQLAAGGAVVVSGAAKGTDMAAHRGALNAGGATLAVLPRGIGTVDFATWRPEFARLGDGGGLLLLSPFERMQPMTRQTPMIRNRLVAALAQAVVVGEAGPASGTLGCLGFALALGVPAFRLAESAPKSRARRAELRVPGPFTTDEAYGESLVRRIVEAAMRFRVEREAAVRAQLRLFEGEDG
jgi:hypothetical protein